MTPLIPTLSRLAYRGIALSPRRAFSTTPVAFVTKWADPRAHPRRPYDPELKHTPIGDMQCEGPGIEGNPDNIPPEGDQDHGRSGWGFQSRSRHEHFTYPGEPKAEYWGDQGWYDFWTPGFKHFYFWAAVVIFVYPSLPKRPKMIVPRGDDLTIRRTDTIARQGPDDERVLLMRVLEWLWAPADDWRKTYWDSFSAEWARIRRNRAFYYTLGDEKTLGRSQTPLAMEHEYTDIAYLPGDMAAPLNDSQMITDRDLALSVGLDTEFFKAQPPIIW